MKKLPLLAVSLVMALARSALWTFTAVWAISLLIQNAHGTTNNNNNNNTTGTDTGAAQGAPGEPLPHRFESRTTASPPGSGWPLPRA